MSLWIEDLAKSLTAAGIHSRLWPAGPGHLLLTTDAARILACHLPGVDGNIFWHQDLREPLRSNGKILVNGGDRLWIGPEIAFMWTDLRQARLDPAKTNVLDPQMDPGAWRVDQERAGFLRLTATMRLTDHRTDRYVSLAVHRQFSLIAPPQGLPRSIRSLAFTIENHAAIQEGDAGAVASLWDLLQLPARGTLICPIVRPIDAPRSYYSPFGERHVRVGANAVRFLIDGERQIKMGMPADVTNGRMGYYRPLGDNACLIVRRFSPQPSEPYVDLPRDSDEVFGGDCLQAYNDDGRLGGFGEMEYHEPALVVGQGPTSRSGRSETFVLVGPVEDILRAGRELLGIAIEPL